MFMYVPTFFYVHVFIHEMRCSPTKGLVWIRTDLLRLPLIYLFRHGVTPLSFSSGFYSRLRQNYMDDSICEAAVIVTRSTDACYPVRSLQDCDLGG